MREPSAGGVFPQPIPHRPAAADKAPLCKGGWRRRRLGDCLAYKMYFSIPPSFCFAKIHLPLHKGGLLAANSAQTPSPPSDEGGVTAGDGGRERRANAVRPYGVTVALRQPPLASPLGERWHAKRDGEGNSRRAADCRPYGRRRFCTNLWLPTRPPCVKGAGAAGDWGIVWRTECIFQSLRLFASRKSTSLYTREAFLLRIPHRPAAAEPCLAPWGEVAREA